MAATDGALLVQTPSGVVCASVMVLPVQTVAVPVMVSVKQVLLTVMIFVVGQADFV